ncbi:MAG TPA: hypothetical protein DC060_15075 [Gemmatimonadetes bacterium]|nr:hypothetical protein [Gemmatimonadota bacterium]HIN50213.1 DUF1501 domain-containing protein [Gemmatimonadota bacterium]
MDRKTFIRGMCYGGIATFALPMVRFAQVPGRGKMVFVLLRGGFDGLAALVPIGDPDYANIRGGMAFRASDIVTLSDEFGLAPGLAPLRQLWDDEELVALHAMAIPYRTRSHFDGQAILETGLARPDGASDGWLNRLLQIMDGERSGIAVAAGMPRSLSGEHSVTTWSPAELGAVDDAYIERLSLLYRADRDLHGRFEAALQMKDVAPDMGGMSGRAPRGQMAPIMSAAAKFLREPGGPNVAALEFSGWDTHANQGMVGGQLDRLLGQLARGVLTFREEMGDEWANTTVVVMTEFGRTARPNGTRGTDHGTAGAGFVIGPNVVRSAVISDWPGLAERSLFESRDLRPTLDTRSVLKGVIAGVFDLTASQADRVFPGSESTRGLYELMR